MKSFFAFGKFRFGFLFLVAALVLPGHLFAGDYFTSQTDDEPEYTTGEYLAMGAGAVVVAGLIIYLALGDIRKPKVKEDYTPKQSSTGIQMDVMHPKGLVFIRW